MKKIIFILVLISTFNIYSQNSVKTNESALTVDKGTVELGFISPLTWGVTDNVELSTMPFLDILYPNLKSKINWIKTEKLAFATLHGLNYPTLLLKTISREGVGGILAPDNNIPEMLGFNNYIIGTLSFNKQQISLKTGIDLAFNFTGDEFETIDYPYLYGNSAVYHSDFVSDTIIEYNISIIPKLNILTNAQILLFDEELGSYEFRHNLKVQYILGKKVSVTGGYLFVTGEYPYGNDWKIFPVLDVILVLR